MSYFRKPPPLYQTTNQAKWWYAMCAYGSNGSKGSPQWARDKHDAMAPLDPLAPSVIRPWWVITHKGHQPATEAVLGEIRERTAKGYRVLWRARDHFQHMRDDVARMADADALPECVGAGNELEFGKQITPAELYHLAQDIMLNLTYFQETYGVKISPPSFSSFVNIRDGYGSALRPLVEGRDGIVLAVHNYRYLDPSMWGRYAVMDETRDILGLPDADVLVEECAYSFAKEVATSPSERLLGHWGTSFHQRALQAAVDLRMPVCPFMNYHQGHHFNDISDPQYGAARYDAGRRLITELRSNV